MKYYDTRTVDGFQVEIAATNSMLFPAPPKSGCQYDQCPGVSIRVSNPFDDHTFAYRQYGAPGHEVKHMGKRNVIGGMGAYVHVWPEQGELDRWIDKHVRELVTKAKQELAVGITRREQNVRVLQAIRDRHTYLLRGEDRTQAEWYIERMDSDEMAEELARVRRELDMRNRLYEIVPSEAQPV